MHYVTETLLVGNAEDARKPPAFVEGILFVAHELVIEPPADLLFARVPLKEFSRPDPLDLKEGVDWLEHHAPNRRLLVCCRAGMGRSVSMVIAYFCCVEGMGYPEAVQLLKARRPGAIPLPELEQVIEAVRRLRKGPHVPVQAQDSILLPGAHPTPRKKGPGLQK